MTNSTPPASSEASRAPRRRALWYAIAVALCVAAVLGSRALRVLQTAAAPTLTSELTKIKDAALLWRAAKHEVGCPTVQQLHEAQFLDPAQLTPLDPWGNAYEIGCREPLRVTSPGPDHQLGTADDVSR